MSTGFTEQDISTADEFNFDEIDEDLIVFQEDDMVQQALHRGVDLKKYGRELEKELRCAENESVLQYVDNTNNVLDLHKQMQECDSVLSRMQDLLLGFQSDLSGISEEIKHLQDESLSMSVRLKNRKAAEEKLQEFINHSTLSVEHSEAIISPDINDDFLLAVLSLNDKLRYLQSPLSDTHTAKTILPDLEKLKLRSISKIKTYFEVQIKHLRNPKTNVQVLQQSNLIKYSKLLQFVQMEAPFLGEELRSVYIESMGRTILNLFKCYSSQLLKLDLVISTKADVIVVEEMVLKSVFSSQVDVAKRTDAFSLNERDRLLDQIESEPILLHVAMAENLRYPFEAILRSVIKHLSDAATSEFLFILDFFKTNSRDTFNKIFGRTLSLILEYLENYLLNCHDVISLLLMIKMTYLQHLVMQRRRIPVLDSFFDRISLLLWPRLKAVLEANLRSIRTANPRKLGAIDLSPHYVSKRYAEFMLSVVVLQGGGSGEGTSSAVAGVGLGGGGDSMLHHDLLHLHTEMAALLDKMAATLPTTKERAVFLINNFDQILSSFIVRRLVCEESQRLEELLSRQREIFAEEEIRYSFPRLISFVLQTEQALASQNGSGGSSNYATGSGQSKITLTLDEILVETLVREFASNWRAGIQQINDDVLAHFANFRNGMEILKQVLTQLLLYYTRFQEIIKRCFARTPSFSREIVSTATILMEIKRYSRLS